MNDRKKLLEDLKIEETFWGPIGNFYTYSKHIGNSLYLLPDWNFNPIVESNSAEDLVIFLLNSCPFIRAIAEYRLKQLEKIDGIR